MTETDRDAPPGGLNGRTHPGRGQDYDEAERFLILLDPEAERFTFQTFDENKERKDKSLTSVIHGSLAEVFDRLCALNDRGAGVFVTINETDFRGRSAENVVRVRAFFIDNDGTPQPQGFLDPTIVVTTSSEDHSHTYYKATGVALGEFTAKQQWLITKFQGDESVKDLPRVMRLPGFFHRKHEPRMVKITASNGGAIYTSDQFPMAVVPPPRQPEPDDDPFGTEPELVAAMAVIPNKIPAGKKENWKEWSDMSLRVAAATGINGFGLSIFDRWSQKNKDKYNELHTRERWEEIKSSPPTKTGAGKIFAMATEAMPRWRSLIGLSASHAEEVLKMSEMPESTYEGLRKEVAKSLGYRVTFLDGLVEALRAPTGDDDEINLQGKPIKFEPIVPWPDEIDGLTLTKEMVAAIRSHVVLAEHQALTIALWILHAHAIEAAEHTPRLQLKSPMPRCGKTTGLSVVKGIVPKPLATESITTAALFRVIAKYGPTLMIDEADSFLKHENGSDNEDLKGILNAGHRRGGAVTRAVGEDHEPRSFDVFAAICFAWLVEKGRTVSRTLEDRSITIELRRRKKDEKITRLRTNRTPHLEDLKRKVARWVGDHMAILIDADPTLPEELNDRAQDNWRPLIAIADAISADLGQKVRDDAIKIGKENLSSHEEDYSTVALGDVAAIFVSEGKDKLRSADILVKMNAMTDRPWNTWGRQRQPITNRILSSLLRPFGIKPKQLRFSNVQSDTGSGYARAPVLEARDRFVEEEAVELEEEAF